MVVLLLDYPDDPYFFNLIQVESPFPSQNFPFLSFGNHQHSNFPMISLLFPYDVPFPVVFRLFMPYVGCSSPSAFALCRRCPSLRLRRGLLKVPVFFLLLNEIHHHYRNSKKIGDNVTYRYFLYFLMYQQSTELGTHAIYYVISYILCYILCYDIVITMI